MHDKGHSKRSSVGQRRAGASRPLRYAPAHTRHSHTAGDTPPTRDRAVSGRTPQKYPVQNGLFRVTVPTEEVAHWRPNTRDSKRIVFGQVYLTRLSFSAQHTPQTPPCLRPACPRSSSPFDRSRFHQSQLQKRPGLLPGNRRHAFLIFATRAPFIVVLHCVYVVCA